jgi:membrane-bound serine protease (ClpP class)
VASLALVVTVGAAHAQDEPQDEPPAPVDVIEVRGRVDAVAAHFITRSIREAERTGSQVLVIQLDSPGALVPDARLDEVAFVMTHARLPVTVWVGPSGAEAAGGAVRLVRAAAVAGMATNTRLGPFRGECALCPPGDPRLPDEALRPEEAEARGAVDLVAPTLGDFIVGLDGREVGGEVLRTARVVQRDTPRREPIAEVRFAKLGLAERVLHATTTPWVAYVLLVVGLLLILFEFFSIGIGLAGLTGALSLALSSYGLAALDATWAGLVLVALAVFGFAVDVQAGAPRAWTAIGTVAFAAGSWLLLPGDVRLGWLLLVATLAGVLVFVVRAMPSVVRARFSTATIGRESMIGEPAEATSDVNPEGMVRLRGGLWRARATRASRIEAGDRVRVVALDGLVLEVEPVDEGPPADPAPGDESQGG